MNLKLVNFFVITLIFSLLNSSVKSQFNQAIAPTFYLFTRGNRNQPETIRWNNVQDLRNSAQFNGQRPTKMIIHGYFDSARLGNWMRLMKDQFLNFGDFNVFIVDWSRGAQVLSYGQAMSNARAVGAMIGQQIRSFSGMRGANPSNFHLLGHSLGGQVVGFAGKSLGFGVLGQITGLDPAGPGYEGASPQNRLSSTDAQFVDVIHTDSGRLGMAAPIGTVDIYANGGQNQPGCARERFTSFAQGLAEG